MRGTGGGFCFNGGRFLAASMLGFRQACGNRYRLASLDLSGVTVYTLLRGSTAAMQDFLLDREGLSGLMNTIVEFQCDLILPGTPHLGID